MAVINAENDTIASLGILDVVELVLLNGLYLMMSTLLGLLQETVMCLVEAFGHGGETVRFSK